MLGFLAIGHKLSVPTGTKTLVSDPFLLSSEIGLRPWGIIIVIFT